jgi:hypothetical protein
MTNEGCKKVLSAEICNSPMAVAKFCYKQLLTAPRAQDRLKHVKFKSKLEQFNISKFMFTNATIFNLQCKN